jgi:hypothetical protein
MRYSIYPKQPSNLPKRSNPPGSQVSFALLRNWNNGIVEYWNNGFKGISNSQESSFPLLFPPFHHSHIPPFQFGMQKTINKKKHNIRKL